MSTIPSFLRNAPVLKLLKPSSKLVIPPLLCDLSRNRSVIEEEGFRERDMEEKARRIDNQIKFNVTRLLDLRTRFKRTLESSHTNPINLEREMLSVNWTVDEVIQILTDIKIIMTGNYTRRIRVPPPVVIIAHFIKKILPNVLSSLSPAQCTDVLSCFIVLDRSILKKCELRNLIKKRVLALKSVIMNATDWNEAQHSHYLICLVLYGEQLAVQKCISDFNDRWMTHLIENTDGVQCTYLMKVLDRNSYILEAKNYFKIIYEQCCTPTDDTLWKRQIKWLMIYSQKLATPDQMRGLVAMFSAACQLQYENPCMEINILIPSSKTRYVIALIIHGLSNNK